MPIVTFYLNKNDYEKVRAKALMEDIPLSKLIRLSVEKYILSEEQKKARKEILKLLKRELQGSWEEVHKERTEADACRR
ncbi:MAG: hypothetical protein AB1488_04900 [Nitrospirota bacterium]